MQPSLLPFPTRSHTLHPKARSELSALQQAVALQHQAAAAMEAEVESLDTELAVAREAAARQPGTEEALELLVRC